MNGDAFSQAPLLVLAPIGTDEFLLAGSVPGVIVITAQCGHSVWISPSGRRILASRKLTTVCLRCAMASGPPDGMKIAPGARAELVAMGVPDEAIDDMLAKMQAEEM